MSLSVKNMLGGSGGGKITNGTIGEFYATSEDIEPNTLIKLDADISDSKKTRLSIGYDGSYVTGAMDKAHSEAFFIDEAHFFVVRRGYFDYTYLAMFEIDVDKNTTLLTTYTVDGANSCTEVLKISNSEYLLCVGYGSRIYKMIVDADYTATFTLIGSVSGVGNYGSFYLHDHIIYIARTNNGGYQYVNKGVFDDDFTSVTLGTEIVVNAVSYPQYSNIYVADNGLVYFGFSYSASNSSSKSSSQVIVFSDDNGLTKLADKTVSTSFTSVGTAQGVCPFFGDGNRFINVITNEVGNNEYSTTSYYQPNILKYIFEYKDGVLDYVQDVGYARYVLYQNHRITQSEILKPYTYNAIGQYVILALFYGDKVLPIDFARDTSIYPVNSHCNGVIGNRVVVFNQYSTSSTPDAFYSTVIDVKITVSKAIGDSTWGVAMTKATTSQKGKICITE